MRTLTALAPVSRCLLVVAQDRRSEAEAIVRQFAPWRCPVEVVEGGAERQDSVANGLACVRSDEDLVVIHDAARPFLPASCALRCIEVAAAEGAAIVALPAHDTIKLAHADGTIERTISRDRVWLAQTPQVFRTELLHRAVAEAKAKGLAVTDDASIAEAAGIPVRLVAGDEANRKVTTPADFAWAEWYAGCQGRGAECSELRMPT